MFVNSCIFVPPQNALDSLKSEMLFKVLVHLHVAEQYFEFLKILFL